MVERIDHSKAEELVSGNINSDVWFGKVTRPQTLTVSDDTSIATYLIVPLTVEGFCVYRIMRIYMLPMSQIIVSNIFRYITKCMYLQNSKRLVIWNVRGCRRMHHKELSRLVWKFY